MLMDSQVNKMHTRLRDGTVRGDRQNVVETLRTVQGDYELLDSLGTRAGQIACGPL